MRKMSVVCARFFAVFFGFIVLSVNAANEYYVSPIDGVPAGSDAADGSAATPFLTVTNALAHAADGDTIWLYSGGYEVCSTNKDVPYIRIDKGVRIKSLSGPENTYFTNGKGVSQAYAFYLNHEDASVEGVMVKDFNTNVSYNNYESGTFTVYAGMVSNCVVRNLKSYYVGAIALKGADAKAIDCLIDGSVNSDSLSQTAGIYIKYGGGKAIGCKVYNALAHVGAGFQIENASAVVSNCVIANCSSRNTGRGGQGAVYLSNGTFVNCVVTNNVALSGNVIGGAGINMSGGTVRGCLIAYNIENTANGGGGVYMTGGTLENCTIAYNKATARVNGQGLRQTGGTVRNCIIALNGASHVIPSENDHEKTGGECTYSCTWPNSITGDGNLYFNPYFINPEGGDFHLGSASELFNAGQNQAWMEGAIDLEGEVRILDDTVNMGCYEDKVPLERPFTASIEADIIEGAAPLVVNFESTLKFVPNEDDLKYGWKFGTTDGTATKDATYTFTTPGTYVVELSVTSGVKVASADFEIKVGTSTAFVNCTGSGVWPYDTAETATNDINVALASLYAPQSGGRALLTIGEGTYYPADTIQIAKEPIYIKGDKAAISGDKLTDKTTTPFILNEANSLVEGVEFFTTSSGRNSNIPNGSALTIYDGVASNCVVRDSKVDGYTYTAFYMTGGTFTDGVIRNVSSSDSGLGGGGRPAFKLEGANAKLLNTVISNSVSSAVGGGELVSGLVSNCTFTACKKTSTSTPTLPGTINVLGGNVINCSFTNCSTIGSAPIVMLNKGSAVLRNSLVADNTMVAGTALYIGYDGACRVENCTIAGNSQSDDGIETPAGCRLSKGTLHNTIVWGNTNKSGDQSNLIVTDATTGKVEYCMTNNPSFRKIGNYRLKSRSPARDVGENLIG